MWNGLIHRIYTKILYLQSPDCFIFFIITYIYTYIIYRYTLVDRHMIGLRPSSGSLTRSIYHPHGQFTYMFCWMHIPLILPKIREKTMLWSTNPDHFSTWIYQNMTKAWAFCDLKGGYTQSWSNVPSLSCKLELCFSWSLVALGRVKC